MKKTSLIFLAFLFIVPVLSFAAPGKSAPAKTDDAKTTADPVVITIGEMQIHKSEFEIVLATLPPEYQVYVSKQGKRAFADDYVRMKVLAREAEATKLDRDPKVADQLRLVRENTMASAMLAQVETTIVPSEQQIGLRYEQKKGELEKVKARHILIAYEGSPASRPERKLSDEQAKAKAEEVHKKLVDGADFAELAKAESDDTFSGEKGGDLGSFGRGQMVGEFEEIAFKIEVGKVSDVFRTQYGYHIMQVTERGAPPLTEVHDQLSSEIKQELMQ